MPGVHRVEAAPLNGLPSAVALPRLVRRLRRRRYDLAIDPCLSSTTNRVALAVCGARLKLGFAVQDGWAPLTHAVTPQRELTHEGLRPLELLRAALPESTLRLTTRMDLGLSESELEEGRRLLDRSADGVDASPRVGFFTQAAAGKQLGTEWWQAWIAAVSDGSVRPRLVEVLPPGVSEPVATGVAALSHPDPRRLGAALAGLSAFVSCDTGPMHLASAAGVPTLGLFRATDVVQYGPYGPLDRVLDARDLAPAQAAWQVLEHLTQRS